MCVGVVRRAERLHQALLIGARKRARKEYGAIARDAQLDSCVVNVERYAARRRDEIRERDRGHNRAVRPSRGAAPSRSDQHIKPDKPKPWAKQGANVKHGASDAAVPPTFSRREKLVIAAVTAAMVEQRGKPASEVQAVATEALATILGKTKNGKQGQPREVGDAGRAAQAKLSKAEKAFNRKKAEADDVEDEEDSD